MFIPAYSSLQTPYSLCGHKSRFHHSSRYPSWGYLPIRGFKAVDTFELRVYRNFMNAETFLGMFPPFFFFLFFLSFVIFLLVQPNLNIDDKSTSDKSRSPQFEFFKYYPLFGSSKLIFEKMTYCVILLLFLLYLIDTNIMCRLTRNNNITLQYAFSINWIYTPMVYINYFPKKKVHKRNKAFAYISDLCLKLRRATLSRFN